MKKSVPIYICVSGTASDEEDEGVQGVHLTMVDADLDTAFYASAALDTFHEHCGISVLDDFSITAVGENGSPLDEPEDQESYELGHRAEYCGQLNSEDVPFDFDPDANE